MADRQVRVDLVATDDASDTIKQVAREAGALEDLDPTVQVDAETAPAKRSVEDLIRTVGNLTDEDATIVLAMRAGTVQRELADTLQQVERLDAADPEVTVQLEKAAAARSDLDQLEQSILDLNQTTVKPQVDTSGLDRAKRTSQDTADTFQRGVGPLRGFTDELGGASQAAGTAANAFIDGGEAIQVFGAQAGLSEGALAGASTAFAAAGIVVAGGVALWQHFSKQAQEAAKRVTEWRDALRKASADGGNSMDAISDKVTDLTNASTKLTGTLNDLGVSGKEFAQNIAGDVTPHLDEARKLLDRFAEAQRHSGALSRGAGENVLQMAAALGLTADQLLENVDQAQRYTSAVDKQSSAVAKAKGENAAAAEVQATLTSATADAEPVTLDLAAAQEAQQQSTDALRDATDSYVASLQEQVDAATNAADAQLAAADAAGKFLTAAGDTAKLAKEGKTNTDEYRQAVANERDALIDAAKAAQRLADETAKAQGKSQTATEKVDSYNKSLEANARYASPAAKRAAYEYILQLNQIPESESTDILALVDQGLLDEADRQIEHTSRTRQTAVDVSANTAQAETDIQRLIRARNLTVNLDIIAKGGAGYGSSQTPRSVAAMAPPAAAVNITQVFPRGFRTAGVVEDARAAARRHGGLYHRTTR